MQFPWSFKYTSASWRHVERLRASSEVDYRTQMGLKRKVLSRLAERFLATPSSRRDEFQRALSENPDLDNYAAFRAVCDRRREGCRQDPPRSSPLRFSAIRPRGRFRAAAHTGARSGDPVSRPA